MSIFKSPPEMTDMELIEYKNVFIDENNRLKTAMSEQQHEKLIAVGREIIRRKLVPCLSNKKGNILLLSCGGFPACKGSCHYMKTHSI